MIRIYQQALSHGAIFRLSPLAFEPGLDRDPHDCTVATLTIDVPGVQGARHSTTLLLKERDLVNLDGLLIEALDEAPGPETAIVACTEAMMLLDHADAAFGAAISGLEGRHQRDANIEHCLHQLRTARGSYAAVRERLARVPAPATPSNVTDVIVNDDDSDGTVKGLYPSAAHVRLVDADVAVADLSDGVETGPALGSSPLDSSIATRVDAAFRGGEFCAWCGRPSNQSHERGCRRPRGGK